MIRLAALCLSAFCATLLWALPLWAQTDLRAEDAARLAGYETAAGNALLQALAGGAAKDVAALTKALSGTPEIAFDESLSGDWNCRTMKLGGLSALIVYTNFKCRFTIGTEGFDFEKLSGSQRTKGTIRLRDGRAIYTGVGFVKGAQAPAYAELPAGFTSNGDIKSQVAVFERLSQNRARLLFPSPALESDFDILELTR